MKEREAAPPAVPVRLEDARLTAGHGRFIDDIELPGMLFAAFVRSPLAHAQITGMDCEAARAIPGVRCVLAADVLEREGVAPLACEAPIAGLSDPGRSVMASDRVRHVGEIVAMVVADTAHLARDAVEAVAVEYAELTPVPGLPAKQGQTGARLHESIAENRAYHWQVGDRPAVEKAIAAAAHIVDLTVENNRLVINPMEPRGAVGLHDRETDAYTLYAPTQGVHLMRNILAENVLGIARERLRVVTGDVGGAFGIRLQVYPEYPLLLLAARLAGAAVKWVAERSETYLCDAHGRAQVNSARLVLDEQGGFTALQVSSQADLGAYLSTFAGIVASTSGTRVLGHAYAIPAIHVEVTGIFTNTVPVDSFRGAGKPEMIYLLERAIEKAAVELGVDPVALRRRNLIAADALPYVSPVGTEIDCGDFEAALDRALQEADWAGFEAKREAARRRGWYAGVGLGLYVHTAGAFSEERSEVSVDPSGTVSVSTGSQSAGQGHETIFAAIAADRLGLAPGVIRIVQGDSDLVPPGGGTGGSNSVMVSGTTIAYATDRLIEKGRELAAAALEAASGDVEFTEGRFRVAGTDLSIGLFDLAARASELGEAEGLSAGCDYDGASGTYPNGCYIAEVEVDPETGHIRLTGFTAVDDIGVAMNGEASRGQIAGGIVQSIGQALLEHTAYDAASGQLLSGSLMDYALPRADDIPDISHALENIPTTANLFGAKGVGEIGALGALAPVVNAVLDALRPLGVEHIDMPLTPERVWQAIRSAADGDIQPALLRD